MAGDRLKPQPSERVMNNGPLGRIRRPGEVIEGVQLVFDPATVATAVVLGILIGAAGYGAVVIRDRMIASLNNSSRTGGKGGQSDTDRQ